MYVLYLNLNRANNTPHLRESHTLVSDVQSWRRQRNYKLRDGQTDRQVRGGGGCLECPRLFFEKCKDDGYLFHHWRLALGEGHLYNRASDGYNASNFACFVSSLARTSWGALAY